jgi:polysaccharide biosynthesis protein PelF
VLQNTVADICLISEGSYPYYLGGVAGWAHELIREHKERTFYVLTLMPPRPDLTFRYEFPENVVGHSVFIVQDLLPGAAAHKTPKETWNIIKQCLLGLIQSKNFSDFDAIFHFFDQNRHLLGKKILCESKEAWDFFLNLYQRELPFGPFKDYFSTIFVLSRSLYSLILPELPRAKMYHALCTGYAGFLLHLAKKMRNVPCILTEQGIYTNERRIEIAMAEWISEVGSLNLALEEKKATLKDFWLNAFYSFAHVCYQSCDKIISTFDGNQENQLSSGADPQKMETIVHGIRADDYRGITRFRNRKQPKVAFIGRIVPIKDVKTFIRACQLVHEVLPYVVFYALGPTEEDKSYFEECKSLVSFLGLDDVFKFFGKVEVKHYFSDIDLVVLTSLSETQPRIIMEAGSLGIPSVTTNVGACYQLCHGRKDESPHLGQGGIVTALSNPQESAYAIIQLLTDETLYQKCSEAIAKRILTYYRYEQQHDAYRKLYAQYLGES